MAFCFTAAHSQAGTLDPTFGTAGIVKSNLFYAGGAAAGRKTFVQPNGNLLTVVQEGPLVGLAGFLSDGRFDASYFNTHYQYASELTYGDAVQDGEQRIVIAGTKYADFAITRYDTQGFIDTEVNFGFPQPAVATAIALQEDGKIVVAGYTYSNGTAQFAVARCLPDGTPDNSFSGDGRQVTSNGNNGAFATDVAIQADGKIVVGGYAGGYGARRDFAVVRYNPDGTRDLTFSGDGKQLTTVGVYDDLANAIAIQEDGKIVLAGRTQQTAGSSGTHAMAAVRYLPNGSLDATFDGDGIAITPIGTFAEASAVIIQSGAKILLAGTTNAGGTNDFALLRYNSNGSLDAGFGSAGKQRTDINNTTDRLSTALLTDGKILLTGWSDSTGNTLRNIALAQYTADGAPDVAFNSDGKAASYFSIGITGFKRVSVQPDGKVLAVGYTESSNFYEDYLRFALARYNPDGSFDTSFGNRGKVAAALSGFGAGGDAFGLQPGGKIVVGGSYYNFENGTEDFVLMRFTADGTVDATFGTDGTSYIDFSGEMGSIGADQLIAIAIQPDGKIVAVGMTDDGAEGNHMAVARCNADGSLDGSFGGDGKQAIRVTGLPFERAMAVALQSDGKIVVAGTTTSDVTLREIFAVARLNTNGALDPSFSSDGKLTTAFGPSSNNRLAALAIQPDKKIVVGGTSNGNFALVRYHANGNLDLSFSGDGKQTSGFGGNDGINALVVQPDGKIMAAGIGNGRFALARYNANGLPDGSFGVDGKQTTDVASGSMGEEITDIALSGNRLYAVGRAQGQENISVGVVAAYQVNETTQVTKTTKAAALSPSGSALLVSAFPNPAAQYFTIHMRTDNAATINVRVTDAAGRVVEAFQNVPATGRLQLGAHYPSGVYYAEVRQGTETKTIKLIKK